MADASEAGAAPHPGFRQSGRGEVKRGAQIVMARERGELELVDRKVYAYLINRVYRSLQQGREETHTVPVSDVLEYLGHSSTDRLHASLSRLGSVAILIDYVDDDGVKHSAQARYLSYDMARSPDGWVEISFDAILQRFLRYPRVFSVTTLGETRRFTSKYAERLYEIMALQVNKQHPVWEPTLEVFRETLPVTDGYARYDNLRRRVVDPAVDEVNTIAPFSVDVEDVRSGKGGRVVALRFTAVAKGPRTLRTLSDGAASFAAAAGGGRRRGRRDPDTVDLLYGKSDADRDPLELAPDTVRQAAAQSGPDGAGAYMDEWRERMRGRRVRDPDRAFLNWLDVRLAKQADADIMGILDDDTIPSLVEGWEVQP